MVSQSYFWCLFGRYSVCGLTSGSVIHMTDADVVQNPLGSFCAHSHTTEKCIVVFGGGLHDQQLSPHSILFVSLLLFGLYHPTLDQFVAIVYPVPSVALFSFEHHLIRLRNCCNLGPGMLVQVVLKPFKAHQFIFLRPFKLHLNRTNWICLTQLNCIGAVRRHPIWPVATFW